MDVLTAITERKSVRAFLNNPISSETIQSILQTARWAPSGVNTQPWFVTVIGQQRIKAIGDNIIKLREQGTEPNPDYQYYPRNWFEPYKSRRKSCGVALYSALNIQIDETEKRKTAWYRNYYFFNAPVGLLFSVDKTLDTAAWLDSGMFLQNVMLAAKGHGLATCPQASLSEYPDIVRKFTQIPDTQALICGMALGYEDNEAPINQYRTTREPIQNFTKFLLDD